MWADNQAKKDWNQILEDVRCGWLWADIENERLD